MYMNKRHSTTRSRCQQVLALLATMIETVLLCPSAGAQPLGRHELADAFLEITTGDPDAAAAAAEVDDVARGLPDAEAAQLAAQHADLGGRLAALQEHIAVAAAVADLQARLDDFDAQVAAGEGRACFLES